MGTELDRINRRIMQRRLERIQGRIAQLRRHAPTHVFASAAVAEAGADAAADRWLRVARSVWRVRKRERLLTYARERRGRCTTMPRARERRSAARRTHSASSRASGADSEPPGSSPPPAAILIGGVA